MKKIFFVVTEKDRNVCLEKLREAGVLHIEKKKVSSEVSYGLLREREILQEATGVLRRYPVKKNAEVQALEAVPPDMAAYVLHLAHDKETLQKELVFLAGEKRQLESWGEFDPWSLDYLTQNGVKLFPYEFSPHIHKRIGDDIKIIVMYRDKRVVRAFSVGEKIPDLIPVDFSNLSLTDIKNRIDVIHKRVKEIETKLAYLAHYKKILEAENHSVLEKIEFETASAGMETLEDVPEEFSVCWITGYIPGEDIYTLEEIAAENSWALLWRDPSPGDRPPTVLRNKPAVRIIQPLFSLLGTYPGYREFDISLSYMVFLCLFFAMIFGDAVYGILLLVLGTAVGMVFKKKSGAFPDAAKLVMLLAASTLVWGTVNGSWLGTPAEKLPPVLQALILPPFNNTGPVAKFPGFLQKIFNLPEEVPTGELKTQWNIQFLCFSVGMVQLVWARWKNFKKLLPSLSALSHAGWLIAVAGIYFVVLFMFLKVEFPSFVPWLIGGGVGLVIIFSEQHSPVAGFGNFLKNIGKSLSDIISIVLKAISSFADIISYIRLFAVGMAGSMIVQTVNSMAIPSEGFGSFGPAFILKLVAAALILVIGHALNLMMGGLSVIVHAVRLNLLEYSGNHLGMEWSGYVYRPFAFRKKKI
jgi:V/A-type H+-transporting ATPase subunit I